MKFGEYLLSQIEPEWASAYLDYQTLKGMIKSMEDSQLYIPDTSTVASLSTPLPINAAGKQLEKGAASQEEFFTFVEQQMRKIEKFTRDRVTEYRQTLASILNRVDILVARHPSTDGTFATDPEVEVCRQLLHITGDSFLRLEKYVNLNFMAFIKILKKHDKRLPNPCRAFYIARLREQSWVRGDCSDVMVTMSRIHSMLRKDHIAEAKDDTKQAFVRSTRKYWVHTEDISRVKYLVLQHLPVFLQQGMDGETDAQLTTSIYVDNFALELYKGRLEKSPSAIALRFRWYGNQPPETVFVERKTHRESWMGEMSVKERFTVKEPQVLDLLKGKFDIPAEVNKLHAKGKSFDDIEAYTELATEVFRAINSKQLFPTMRTQYMRTAYQIPYDATVRISLDTNLTMITERTSDTLALERWYRDPNKVVPANEITRFPYAVLEIKLQLLDESATPAWVTELIEGGMLIEVHKFSKFIHGCAVLLPEDVPAMPYWIDDVTLAESVIASGAGHILKSSTAAVTKNTGLFLPHDANGNAKAKLAVVEQPKLSPRSVAASATTAVSSPAPPTSSVGVLHHRGSQKAIVSDPDHYVRMMDDDDNNDLEKGKHRDHNNDSSSSSCCCLSMLCCGVCCSPDGGGCELFSWADEVKINHVTTQKVEPKIFFANERTFMHWLNMAVFMSSIAIAVMAFATNDGISLIFALLLLVISLLFIVYALRTYLDRGTKIATRSAERWDDPYGPPLLAGLLAIVLIAVFFTSLVSL